MATMKTMAATLAMSSLLLVACANNGDKPMVIETVALGDSIHLSERKISATIFDEDSDSTGPLHLVIANESHETVSAADINVSVESNGEKSMISLDDTSLAPGEINGFFLETIFPKNEIDSIKVSFDKEGTIYNFVVK